MNFLPWLQLMRSILNCIIYDWKSEVSSSGRTLRELSAGSEFSSVQALWVPWHLIFLRPPALKKFLGRANPWCKPNIFKILIQYDVYYCFVTHFKICLLLLSPRSNWITVPTVMLLWCLFVRGHSPTVHKICCTLGLKQSTNNTTMQAVFKCFKQERSTMCHSHKVEDGVVHLFFTS